MTLAILWAVIGIILWVAHPDPSEMTRGFLLIFAFPSALLAVCSLLATAVSNQVSQRTKK